MKPAPLVVTVAGMLLVTVAEAAPPRPERVPISRDQASLWLPGGSPPSREIFMNDCKPDGCQIYVGSEDSRRNRSTVARRTSLVPPFPYSDATWQATLACVRETYGQFNINVTDVDPCPDPNSGCTTPHWEIVVAGTPADISYPNNAGGVSPFDFDECSIIENSITYAFAEVLGNDVDTLCWVIAQETAHSFGLDHELLGADPMTYLPSPRSKRFQNVLADCGEDSVRPCYCGRNRQNSVAELLAIFGQALPSAPQIEILNPLHGQGVEPGFPVSAEVTDPQGVQLVELWIDDAKIAELSSPPFAFNAPLSLATGASTIVIRAVDQAGTSGSSSIRVLVGGPCDSAGDCALLDNTYTCVGGTCVPGPGAPGGLGEACVGSDDCASAICATKDAENRCVYECARGSSDCPGGFACLDNGAGGGLCWPDAGGCLGCASSDTGVQPIVPVAAGLVIGALLVRRRRGTVGTLRDR